MVKTPPAMPETLVQSVGGEDFLKWEMATRSSILAWRTLWTEESGRLGPSMGSQRVGYNGVTNTFTLPFTPLEVWLNSLC